MYICDVVGAGIWPIPLRYHFLLIPVDLLLHNHPHRVRAFSISYVHWTTLLANSAFPMTEFCGCYLVHFIQHNNSSLSLLHAVVRSHQKLVNTYLSILFNITSLCERCTVRYAE
jgi:hypothetical protein